MLAKWIFVLMIDGKVTETQMHPSEGKCQIELVKIVPLLRAQGLNAFGACYIRATDLR
ncbi:hypothetical protein IMW75_11020 [Pseudomonas gregormendelii]|uniref:Uncharacterized protein n=1 Tax=Pseudomonas gregormendelii TaxID=1628277 RepID=A0ABS3AHS9_9PSED|nr:hypothetical protein [Pseudomonas gregormendelii]MBN3965799.1 hypothetical protein [Pseudomonas gregormendelii]MBN3965810.1 hypothetical protein [Pseudomonas gregormendelii]